MPPSGIQDDASDALVKSKHVREVASESDGAEIAAHEGARWRGHRLLRPGGAPPASPASALPPSCPALPEPAWPELPAADSACPEPACPPLPPAFAPPPPPLTRRPRSAALSGARCPRPPGRSSRPIPSARRRLRSLLVQRCLRSRLVRRSRHRRQSSSPRSPRCHRDLPDPPPPLKRRLARRRAELPQAAKQQSAQSARENPRS